MALSKLSDATFETLKHHFLEWCYQQGRGKFSLLITGKSGIGKSSLVNALVGKQVAKEGFDKAPCTHEVNSHDIDIEGVKIRVWDSPGLRDGTGNDEKYMAEIKSKITEKPDLVIFCLRMDDKRFHLDDKKTIKILTAHFEKELWENAVIALTFANKVKPPGGGDKTTFFLQDLANWREAINSFLSEELELDSKLLQSLPLVPTGYYQPVSVLPNGGNWLSNFWIACYNVASRSAALKLYRIRGAQVRFTGCENLVAACGGSEVVPTSPGTDDSEIPAINLDEEQQESFWKKTWETFKEYCLRADVMTGVISLVGFTILKGFMK